MGSAKYPDNDLLQAAKQSMQTRWSLSFIHLSNEKDCGKHTKTCIVL